MAPHPKEGDQLAKTYHDNPVPMREHTEKLMVKISAPLTVKKDTAALDIVFVLDTSGSMGKKNKLVLMQHAMNKFITEKLGKADSLTIIPFASAAAKKEDQFYGRTMKDDAVKKAAKDFVGKLKAGGDTNIKAGLEAALDYLDHGRRGSSHYAYCIFLMSDGHENVDKARSLLARVAKHSVVTFGFGENSDEKLLYDIARGSQAGTYHHVREKEDENELMNAFAAPLSIYRSVTMLDLRVTLKPIKETGYVIPSGGVDAGHYEVKHQGSDGSFTIHFGDLAREENRRILVDLKLPEVKQEQKDKIVMQVEYDYSPPKKQTKLPPRPLPIKMSRVRNPGQAAKDPNVSRELVRRAQQGHLKKVMDLADNTKNMATALDQLEKAKDALVPIHNDKDDAVDALVNELENIDEFLETHDIYNKLGRAYLLACISSHGRQRHATRGGALPVNLYLTGRMKKYMDQARDAHNS